MSAKQANRILDSLNALKDARVSAYNFRVAADSSQAEVNRARRAAQNYLEAKEAAQRAEALQHSVAVSNGQKYAEAQRKASHRTVIIVLLAAWNLFTGAYIITH